MSEGKLNELNPGNNIKPLFEDKKQFFETKEVEKNKFVTTNEVFIDELNDDIVNIQPVFFIPFNIIKYLG